MMELLIKAGGIYNIALLSFHLLFWRIFNWEDELRTLSFVNRAIMQVVNLSLTFVFFAFACISMLHTDELLSTPLGNTLLVLIALFWMARAVMQVLFFKLKHPVSVAFLVFFIVGAMLYGLPAIYAMQAL